MDRQKALSQIDTTTYDVIVIGGGIFGACALWEATLRGLKAVLFEAHDFCNGSSANSYKIVHGGTRYVQHFDFPRVRSSSRERRAMLRIAPHMVEPLPVMIPTYGWLKLGKPYLATGLTLYDLITLDRNSGVNVPERRLKSTRLLSKEAVVREFPGVADQGLTGACVFEDGRFYNPTRLVLEFIQSAVARGATAINYCPVDELIIENNRVTGVKTSDKLTGFSYRVDAKTVFSAAGPWTDRLLHSSANEPLKSIKTTYSRDACFVIKRRFPGKYTLAVQGQTKDPDAILSRPARHLFISPWRDYTLVGVWHKVTGEHPEKVTVSEQEIEAFIDEMNASFPDLALTLDDVLHFNCGLVPFGENEDGSDDLSYGKRSLLTDHAITDGLEGLVSLIGLRYTMARGEAENGLDLVQKKLGLKVVRPGSDRIPLPGANFSSFERLKHEIKSRWPVALDDRELDSIAHSWGSRYVELLRYIEEEPALAKTLEGTSVAKAAIVHSCRKEMVCSLQDVLLRRTDIATGGYPGLPVIRALGEILQRELGWSDERREREEHEAQLGFPAFIRERVNQEQAGL